MIRRVIKLCFESLIESVQRKKNTHVSEAKASDYIWTLFMSRHHIYVPKLKTCSLN